MDQPTTQPQQPQNQPVQPQPREAKGRFWKKMLIIYLVMMGLLAVLAWPAYHFEWDVYNLLYLQVLVTIVLLVTLWTIIFHGSPKKFQRLIYAAVCIVVFLGFFSFLGSDLFKEWTPTETACSVDAECIPTGCESCVNPNSPDDGSSLDADAPFELGCSPSNTCRCDQQTSKCEYTDECVNFTPCL